MKISYLGHTHTWVERSGTRPLHDLSRPVLIKYAGWTDHARLDDEHIDTLLPELLSYCEGKRSDEGLAGAISGKPRTASGRHGGNEDDGAAPVSVGDAPAKGVCERCNSGDINSDEVLIIVTRVPEERAMSLNAGVVDEETNVEWVCFADNGVDAGREGDIGWYGEGLHVVFLSQLDGDGLEVWGG